MAFSSLTRDTQSATKSNNNPLIPNPQFDTSTSQSTANNGIIENINSFIEKVENSEQNFSQEDCAGLLKELDSSTHIVGNIQMGIQVNWPNTDPRLITKVLNYVQALSILVKPVYNTDRSDIETLQTLEKKSSYSGIEFPASLEQEIESKISKIENFVECLEQAEDGKKEAVEKLFSENNGLEKYIKENIIDRRRAKDSYSFGTVDDKTVRLAKIYALYQINNGNINDNFENFSLLVSLLKTKRVSSEKLMLAAKQYIGRKKLSSEDGKTDIKQENEIWGEPDNAFLDDLKKDINSKSFQDSLEKVTNLYKEFNDKYHQINPAPKDNKAFYELLRQNEYSDFRYNLEKKYKNLNEDEIYNILKNSSFAVKFVGEQKLNVKNIDDTITYGNFLKEFQENFPFSSSPISKENGDEEMGDENYKPNEGHDEKDENITPETEAEENSGIPIADNKEVIDYVDGLFSDEEEYFDGNILELSNKFKGYTMNDRCKKGSLKEVVKIVSMLKSKYGSAKGLKNILNVLEKSINKYIKDNAGLLEMIEDSAKTNADVDKNKLDVVDMLEANILNAANAIKQLCEGGNQNQYENSGTFHKIKSKLKNGVHKAKNKITGKNDDKYSYEKSIYILAKLLRATEDSKINRKDVYERKQLAADGVRIARMINLRVEAIDAAMGAHAYQGYIHPSDVDHVAEGSIDENYEKLQVLYQQFKNLKSISSMFTDAPHNKNNQSVDNNDQKQAHRPRKVLVKFITDMLDLIEKIEKSLNIEPPDDEDRGYGPGESSGGYSENVFINLQQSEFSEINDDAGKINCKYKAVRFVCRVFGILAYSVNKSKIDSKDVAQLEAIREKYANNSSEESRKLYSDDLNKSKKGDFIGYSSNISDAVVPNIKEDIDKLKDLIESTKGSKDDNGKILINYKDFKKLFSNTIANTKDSSSWIGMPEKFINRFGEILVKFSKKSFNLKYLHDSNDKMNLETFET